ncbi:trypsin-like peptidase domain-containing protein [Acidovorax temperans]|uniref:trypsin-like peptidase domain-containing protein n=1 Tax=Acidovorax temperans TaxID=80878 RepID=UPI00289D12F3|nr:trypsin-like peptidase domain-containing protein [Acidovorax temperans]
MTRISIKRWAGALTAVTALLAGCGGGESSDVATTAKTDTITAVEGRMLPETAVQDVSPVKSRSVTTAPKAARVSLGELSMAKVEMSAPGTPRLVGQARDVQATKSAAALQSLWQWKNTAVGGKVAAISFNAEGAYGLRLGVLVKQLPGSAMVRVYTQSAPDKVFQISGQAILQLIELNQAAGDHSNAASTWWTPDTGEGEATLEIELPPGVPTSALHISVPQLSHIFENLSLPTEEDLAASQRFDIKDIGDSELCNLDSTCYSNGSSERNAVARMVYIKGAGAYLCTGTLLNDANSSGTPYFLSANHCISEQTVASTLQTNWFFRSSSCNSGTLQSSSTRRVGGARLLYASASTDMALLQLNDTPPAGALFAGWDASTIPVGTSVIGLHHPRGDLLKLSLGTVAGQSSCSTISSTQFSCVGSTGNFYSVAFSQGTTEGGSSGSAIFRDGKVIGTLYGGSHTCSNRSGSNYYGRFDVAYNAALKTWLAGSSTSPQPSNRTAVYRFYNATTGAHFYTASAAERDFVIRTYPQFGYENIAFYAYPDASSGKDPVFRFYNPTSGAHFYSGSVAERDFVIANFPEFKYEVVSWYAQTGAGNGASPIYRFYNATTGAHFYTISAAERDFVIQVHKAFRYEGPMYYAWTTAQ